ncbi:hypothetical protein L9F63_016599 [Diploptera punctata]|uniref:Milk protein n=3 Tax=Diploptera punctata TaxID=6984 RepID=A0AAD8A0Y7_DIPPU|nr:hypothetical protein L9F63_016599 [Diploptera punctata]
MPDAFSGETSGNYKPHDHGLQPENLLQDHHTVNRFSGKSNSSATVTKDKMKVVLIFIAAILLANAEKPCPPENLEVPPGAFVGKWYLRSASPDIFENVTNVTEVYSALGNDYFGNVTEVSPEYGQELHRVNLTFSGKNLTLKINDTHEYDTESMILAVDKDYVISYVYPEAVPSGLALIHYRQPCPKEDVIKRVKKALKDVCLDYKYFGNDTSVPCDYMV